MTVEPAYALRLLEKMKLAQEVKAHYGHFHQLTFFECSPVLFGGELISLEQVDKLEKEERLVLDKPLLVPIDVRWETAAIPLSVLEQVASVLLDRSVQIC